MDRLLKYELQRLDKQKAILFETSIDDETFAFWASVLTSHILSWPAPKSEKQKKNVKEIQQATQFIVAYNTTLKMRSDYLLSEVQEFRGNYNKECLKRKELEKTIKNLENEIKHYENEQ